MAITPSKSIKPDNGVNYLGRIKCTLEGANDVDAGEIVYVSDGVFNSDGICRKLEVTRVTATSTDGVLLVAKSGAAVGEDFECVGWQLQQLDTSSGAVGDPVYMTTGGVPTLAGVAGTDSVVGSVLTAATVANGGCIMLDPNGVLVANPGNLGLTLNAEAANAIAIDVQGVAAVAQYKVTVYNQDMLEEVAAAYTCAETGAGAEVSNTAQPTLLFTTDANGAAQITVSDVATTSTETLYVEFVPMPLQGGTVGSSAAIVSITFA